MRTVYFQFFGIVMGILLTLPLFSQSVGINDDGSQPNAAAILDIKSTNKGLLIPRTDTTTINTQGTPPNGLIIYQTSDEVFYYFDGEQWRGLSISDERIFDRVENLVRQHSNFETDDLLFGRNDLPESGENVTDKFLLFSKSKGAFRVGELENSQNWKPSYIGMGSVAFGYNTRASGDYSKAFGFSDQASGYNSFSWGFFTAASGWNATVFGEDAVAVGGNSFSWGEGSQANGWNTTAGGKSTVAPSYTETVLGSYNTIYTPNSTVNWNENDRLFVIGNGSSIARSNALTVLKNGNSTIKGELTLTDGLNPYTFPNTDGNTDEVLMTDGIGSLSWVPGKNLGLFERSGTLIRQKGEFDTDDFIFGRESLPVNGENITDDLFFFDQSESAFRLGHVFNSDGWSPENTGFGSFAVGFNPRAEGNFSIAMGRYTNAASYLETAFGSWNTTYSPLSTTSWNENDRLFVIGNGNSITPNNALTILKNGNTTLKGKLTLTDGTSPYTLPNTDGSADQVLSTDGAGAVLWVDGDSHNVFERDGNLIRQKDHVDNDDIIFGRVELPTNGESVTDTFFFFDKSKGAFRGGKLYNSPNWSPDSIGLYSFAFGYSPKAIGLRSTAWGSFSEAIGLTSTAWGISSKAIGHYSTAWGNNTQAIGDLSTALGAGTKADSYLETVIGQFNTDYIPNSIDSWHYADRLFIIGNGTFSNSSNALTIMKSGMMGLQTVDNPTYALQLPNSFTNGGGKGLAYAWTTYSDTRIKSQQVALDYGLNEIIQLSPKSYFQHHSDIVDERLVVDTENGKMDIGLIAQEVYDIIPEVVNKPEDENLELWGMDYEKLVPVLINAIQEQQQMIKQLEQSLIEEKEDRENANARLEKMEKILSNKNTMR